MTEDDDRSSTIVGSTDKDLQSKNWNERTRRTPRRSWPPSVREGRCVAINNGSICLYSSCRPICSLPVWLVLILYCDLSSGRHLASSSWCPCRQIGNDHVYILFSSFTAFNSNTKRNLAKKAKIYLQSLFYAVVPFWESKWWNMANLALYSPQARQSQLALWTGGYRLRRPEGDRYGCSRVIPLAAKCGCWSSRCSGAGCGSDNLIVRSGTWDVRGPFTTGTMGRVRDRTSPKWGNVFEGNG